MSDKLRTYVSNSLRAAVLSKVGMLTERTQAEIHRLVEDDYGSVSRRTITRALRNLEDAGEITRDTSVHAEPTFLLARRKMAAGAR